MTAITLKRIAQLPAFCGPATLEIMLSQHGIPVPQKTIAQIAQSANALKDIDADGMRIDQLALAVRKLAPHLTIWAKRDASFEDLDTLINTYSLPVAIEWQWVWTEDQLHNREHAKETSVDDDDPGHWSVVTGITLEEKKLMIQDPSIDYYETDREFGFDEFEKQWFDINNVGDDDPEEAKEWMNDYHVLFVIAPKSQIFPESLGLKKVRIAATYKKQSWVEKRFATWVKTISTAVQKMRGLSVQPAAIAHDQNYDPLPHIESTLPASSTL